MQPNDYQRAILRGRDLGELDALDRLAYANAATPEAEAIDDPTEDADDGLTAAQRNYLGDRRPEDLSSKDDLENFEFLGGEMFRTRPPKDAKQEPREEAEKPAPAILELDPAKLAGLSPERRLAAAEALEKLKIAHRESNQNAALRTVRPHEQVAAMQVVQNYLK